MSTYLQLAVSLHGETIDSGAGPTTVTGQVGQLKREVNWVAQAYTEIQNSRPDWLWLRRNFTVNTTASDSEYAYGDCTDVDAAAVITRFDHWYRDTIKCYLSSDGVGSEYPLAWMEWDQFRRIYRYGTQTDGKPSHVSMKPDQSLVIGPAPDGIYVVSGDFQRGPQILAADGDTPEMPSRFHMLIVYEAMAKYAGKNVSTNDMARAISEGGRMWSDLLLNQLPPMTYGAALA